MSNQFQLIERLRVEAEENKTETLALENQIKKMYEEYYVNDLREQNMKWRGIVIDTRKELDNLRIDKKYLQESLDEFGSDTVMVIELPLCDRLTEEEMKVYKEGMEILNSESKMTQEDIDLITSVPFSRQDIENIVLETIKTLAERVVAG